MKTKPNNVKTPSEAIERRAYKSGADRRRAVLRDILKTALILLVASLLCEGLYLLRVGEQNISIVMVLAVFLISASTSGYVYGLAASLAGVLVYDYLVTAPRFGFSITLGFPITLSIMLLVSVVTSTATGRIKRRAGVALEKEQRAELLYEVNRKMLSGLDEGAIAACALDYLGHQLHRSAALFIGPLAKGAPQYYFSAWEKDAGSDFFSSPAEQRAARLAAQRGDAVGVGGVALAGARGHYSPVKAGGVCYAVVGVCCEQGPLNKNQRSFLELITEQTAQALRVRTLTEQRRQAQVAAETEQNRNSFLRGISHDLRTPLTSIIGASATLLEKSASLPMATQIQLVEGIQADAQWLMRMVENILSVTRIHQHGMAIDKTEEMAEEVVGEAVDIFRKRCSSASVRILQPDELLLVPMDSLLITQVVNNLLDNAQRHAGEGPVTVHISMERSEDFALFTVADAGPGIPEERLSALFEIHPAQPGHSEDASRGLGMGLSICKTIIEAHQGWIKAGNQPGGGAMFTFALPLAADEETPSEETQQHGK